MSAWLDLLETVFKSAYTLQSQNVGLQHTLRKQILQGSTSIWCRRCKMSQFITHFKYSQFSLSGQLL